MRASVVRIRLIVSLTSAIDERRRALLPAAAAWPVRELPTPCASINSATGGRVTIAWVVLGGINTGPDEVDALRDLFDGVPLRLNLIDVNDARPDGYRAPRTASCRASAMRCASSRCPSCAATQAAPRNTRPAGCSLQCGIKIEN